MTYEMKRKEGDPLNTFPEDLGNKASDIAEEWTERLEETAAKVLTLKDEMAVRLHLATREARDLREGLLQSVDKVGHMLSDMAKTVDKKLEASQLQLHLGVMEAKERWEITREEAERIIDVLKHDQSKAKQLLDEARLQARLAKLDTKEFLAESQQEIGKGLKELGQQSSQALKRINTSVSEFLGNLG